MHKLLIANRGEIARRIIRTAHAMRIATVAVYSDADAAAPHVREADEAMPIGPAPAAQSYLDPQKILAVARATGADAVHPGYGFLSENAEFARLLEAERIVFVGPPAAAIEAMGLKDAAKRRMRDAGVPVTPGYQGEDQTFARLEHAARSVGYPLLIKAVAGGGGKGMRRVDRPAEFADALVAAQREAERAFGDGRVLLEKYVTHARHVEVQVFADTHGNVVHLHERDCSLQRRHQKVIEEAPAPGLSGRLRHTLGIAAVTAAMAIDYRGAGTIEFIVDLDDHDEYGDPRFYFMEMNTRLQVEHPVTEAITGVDLVEWQLRVARGEPLPLAQDAIRAEGHAMEARLYAEDPETGFLPSTGTLTRLVFPHGPGIRIDTGVEQGMAVTPYYDPMIAKLIVFAPTRESAAALLTQALDRTVVEGVKTNRAFLAQLASHPAFIAGEVSTGFIDQYRDDLRPRTQAPPALVAAAAHALALRPPIPGPFARFGAFRMNLDPVRTLDLWEGGRHHALQLVGDTLSGLEEPVRGAARREGDWIVLGGDLAPLRAVSIEEGAHGLSLRHAGQTYAFTTEPPRAVAAALAGDGRVVAPMPGRVLQLSVKPGQRVAAGDRLVVLEAMKMEHRMTAPADATVRAVHVAEGDQVAEGTALVELELAASP